ncbi:hypothetical protein AVEN_116513-1 [Araneus ventricosus]|uniref:Uncharacterized protein n=1 Tax=Araneus ventricosus TaxID=182803 RepID=A0A4Y2UNS3_ARAVE|nr:hypothetical protein AVEN_116513-1 [Araneus ventricosus]
MPATPPKCKSKMMKSLGLNGPHGLARFPYLHTSCNKVTETIKPEIHLTLADPAQSYEYHDFPDGSRAKLAIKRSKKIRQDKKEPPSGGRITEKWPMHKFTIVSSMLLLLCGSAQFVN